MGTGFATGDAYESLVRDALAETDVPREARDGLRDALVDRIRRNVAQADREVDPVELRGTVRAVAEAVAVRTWLRTVPPTTLSKAEATDLIDRLCQEMHLPWPICPADD